MRIQRPPLSRRARVAAGGLLGAIAFASIFGCAADRSRDYRLEVLDQPVAVGAQTTFDVRLTSGPGERPVENAAITSAGLEMTVLRATHKTPPARSIRTKKSGEVELLGSPQPGIYRFLGDVSRPGTWRLVLTAKLPGEAKAIDAATTFEAVD